MSKLLHTVSYSLNEKRGEGNERRGGYLEKRIAVAAGAGGAGAAVAAGAAEKD